MGLFFIVLMTCAINGSLLLTQLLYSIADIITLFSAAWKGNSNPCIMLAFQKYIRHGSTAF